MRVEDAGDLADATFDGPAARVTHEREHALRNRVDRRQCGSGPSGDQWPRAAPSPGSGLVRVGFQPAWRGAATPQRGSFGGRSSRPTSTARTSVTARTAARIRFLAAGPATASATRFYAMAEWALTPTPSSESIYRLPISAVYVDALSPIHRDRFHVKSSRPLEEHPSSFALLISPSRTPRQSPAVSEASSEFC